MSIALSVMPAKGAGRRGRGWRQPEGGRAGNASYYYSFTRLKTNGTLAVGENGAPRTVSGESWFDHEWASDSWPPDQVGWDWFCFQFDDQTEVMLYAMRRRDGTVDPVSSGTWVEADGQTEHLKCGDFQLGPRRNWLSPQTGAKYPLSWTVSDPVPADWISPWNPNSTPRTRAAADQLLGGGGRGQRTAWQASRSRARVHGTDGLCRCFERIAEARRPPARICTSRPGEIHCRIR